MPAKKRKSKSKQTKSQKPAAKRAKKSLRTKRAVKETRPKRVEKKTLAAKKKRANRKTRSVRAARDQKILISEEDALRSSVGGRKAVSGQQSGDLEGLSRAELSDSESVEELVEEGNLFEAGAVEGVEEADNSDEQEVHTHEVPEDDVPEEYIDKD